jgi:ABC-type branched-subunit amino acid transport system substrate-binding protein
MAVNICADQPAVVLFAGRGQDLGALLHTFSTTCLDKSITIISGDDVTNLPNTAQLRSDLAGKVTVEYAGVAHPQEWNVTQKPPTQAESQGAQGFRTFNNAFQQLFHGASLTDGNTMMAYDATLTSVSAIRLTELKQPGADAVANELGALHDAHKVLGASGPLEFTADYTTSDNGSDPVGKAIPIVRLGPDGNPQVLTVEWPSTAPRLK